MTRTPSVVLALCAALLLGGCETFDAPPHPGGESAPSESAGAATVGSADEVRTAAIAVHAEALSAIARELGITTADDALPGELRVRLPGVAAAGRGGIRALPAPLDAALAPVARLAMRPGVGRVTVQAHTDSIGAELNNLRHSRRLANLIAQRLAAQGVPWTRLVAEGMGEAQPLDSNATPEGRARNRRIEIRLEIDPDSPLPDPILTTPDAPKMPANPPDPA